MPTATATTTFVEPGYEGFKSFAAMVGLSLEPFQRKIAAAADVRELLVLPPAATSRVG